MANINRDYLVINDVKKSNISLDNGSITFYITDKNTQNIFVNLVINISDNKLIQKYASIENAEDYTLTMHIVKPDNTYEIIQGKLHDKANAIFEFDLPDYCCDKVGSYRCELLTKCYINGREEITTSNKITYKVKSSVLNDLDEIAEAPEYPLVIQLFDKLSDIEQYEEDRRANELARQLAEEQRQTRFDTLDTDMTDSIQAMDNKVADVENRIIAKENAVDKLVTDTKADIDNYKVAKGQEIDDYKTAKDTEINEAIANQNTAINTQNDRIAAVENNIVAQNDKLDVLETKATTHEARITAAETKNAEQDGRLDIAENRLANIGNDITNTMQPIIDEHTSRLDAIEAIDVSQNNRLDAIETKNQQQDDRLLDIEKVNNRQDIDIKCLYGASQTIDVTKEGNSIYLQNSNNGFTIVDEIKGNTLVNCNKEPNKELILNGNINTSGDNTVTITEGVDGGLVDVALVGNTLVNVSKTKDSTAITKAYTVENSGNHIALQGDVDGSCRPVITGKTLVNIAKGSLNYPRETTKDGFDSVEIIVNDNYVTYSFVNASKVSRVETVDWFFKLKQDLIEGKTYTVILPMPLNTHNGYFLIRDAKNGINYSSPIGVTHWSFTATATGNNNYYFYTYSTSDYSVGDTVVLNMPKKVMILEGDYSDKPIPDYFEGLQSSFEDNLVTQEMVDSGEEVADNLGKYRVDYEVTGKNKFDINKYFDCAYGLKAICIKAKPNTTYTYSSTYGGKVYFALYKQYSTLTPTDNKNLSNIIFSTGNAQPGFSYTTPNYECYIWMNLSGEDDNQIEEGTVATAYEPYKESTKTLYLNSPLLEGDTIEEKDGGIYHVHRSELVAYTEGDETSSITDKVNTLHGLETPQYELIEQSNLGIPTYSNGHLDFDTAVPVEKVDFLPFSEELTYLYANTQYTVQFISTKAILADLILGGALLLSQSIVAGLNRISITTPSELVDNKLTINGNNTGANIMEVIVSDIDRELIYFEGMKSVGEGKELQVISINSERRLVNTQRLTHEPLRGTRNAKDRYVLIDGKWYIERKCGIRAYQKGDEDNYKTDLVNTVYPLEMPTYEEIDYNPLEVYSGTTNITTNSTIPTNIVVKNHGYNCLLKPSTTYTVSSNLGLNTVTTPSTLTEDCLRFMDTDTSDVTTMRDVLVLEGDWTTKADLIPVNFSGIESAFEQEYDAEKGKYKVNAKVVGKNLFDINKVFKTRPDTDFTISENVLTVSGKWYIDYIIPDEYKGKTLTISYEKNGEGRIRLFSYINGKYNSIQTLLNGSTFVIPNDNYQYRLVIYASSGTNATTTFSNIQIEKGDTATAYKPYKENNITFYIDEPLRGVGTAKDRVYVKDDKVVVQRNCDIRPYEDGDFGTYLTDKVNTVYELAEPTYEEVEYNDTKLFIESFKNSTLSYNSNVPVTSTVHYSYSVPIVDTVAQTADVADQQDSMIIDLATQVAVMEMMLM